MVFEMCVCYLYWILQFCYERVIFINVIYLSINSDELCDCTELNRMANYCCIHGRHLVLVSRR